MDQYKIINWNFCNEHTVSNPNKIQKTKKVQNLKFLPSISTITQQIIPDIEECESTIRKRCSTCVYTSDSLPPINCIMNNKCNFI